MITNYDRLAGSVLPGAFLIVVAITAIVKHAVYNTETAMLVALLVAVGIYMAYEPLMDIISHCRDWLHSRKAKEWGIA